MAPVGAVTADFFAAVIVKMTITNFLTAEETVTHGSGLNTFCSACHVDYNTQGNKADGMSGGSGSVLTGTYTEAYRHQVGYKYNSTDKLATKNMKLEAGNIVTCETCHVAHGTDQTYWNDTLTKANSGALPTGIAAEDLKEIAGSSALKRLPNMGVCETCHGKGAGNQGYEPVVTPVSSDNSKSSAGGGYVGQAACSQCHVDYFEHFQSTWHPQKTRPGVTEAVDEEVAPNAVAINAIVPGLSDAILSTQAEVSKVGERVEISNPLNWIGKNVDPTKITVWSWGKDTSRIAARGSYLTANAVPGTYSADKWYLVASYDEATKQFATGKTTSQTQPFGEYNCFNSCHTTGYDATKAGYANNSSDLTNLWLNKVAAGQKPAFDLGVTCEACHGQAGNHVKAPSKNNIIKPTNLPMQVQSVGLGAPGTSNTYLDTTSKAKSCGACHSSATHQGDFFASSLKYSNHGVNAYSADTASPLNSSSPSQHFIQGLLSCNSCHNSHEKTVGNQLIMKSPNTADIGTQLCGTCHSNIKTLTDIEYYMPMAGTEAGFGYSNSGIRKHGAALNVPQHDPANGQ